MLLDIQSRQQTVCNKSLESNDICRSRTSPIIPKRNSNSVAILKRRIHAFNPKLPFVSWWIIIMLLLPYHNITYSKCNCVAYCSCSHYAYNVWNKHSLASQKASSTPYIHFNTHPYILGYFESKLNFLRCSNIDIMNGKFVQILVDYVGVIITYKRVLYAE